MVFVLGPGVERGIFDVDGTGVITFGVGVAVVVVAVVVVAVVTAVAVMVAAGTAEIGHLFAVMVEQPISS